MSMTQPIALQTLPELYQPKETTDLSKQKKLALGLNLAGIGIFIVIFYLLTFIVSMARGLDSMPLFSMTGTTSAWLSLLGIIAGFIALIVLHEAAHGLFFWFYTRSMPKFAMKLSYAYAAAPDWFIRRNAYRIVATAPIFIITGLGLLICLFAPVTWLMGLILFMSINFASAIGDLYVILRLWKVPESTYIQDAGDRMTFFTQSTNLVDDIQ
jgi:hypothetical protein